MKRPSESIAIKDTEKGERREGGQKTNGNKEEEKGGEKRRPDVKMEWRISGRGEDGMVTSKGRKDSRE